MDRTLFFSPTPARECVYKALDDNGHDVTTLEMSYMQSHSLVAGESIWLRCDFQNRPFTQKVLQKASAVSLPLIFLSILAIFSPSPSPSAFDGAGDSPKMTFPLGSST